MIAGRKPILSKSPLAFFFFFFHCCYRRGFCASNKYRRKKSPTKSPMTYAIVTSSTTSLNPRRLNSVAIIIHFCCLPKDARLYNQINICAAPSHCLIINISSHAAVFSFTTHWFCQSSNFYICHGISQEHVKSKNFY